MRARRRGRPDDSAGPRTAQEYWPWNTDDPRQVVEAAPAVAVAGGVTANAETR
jgi:hypothetical protein